MYAVVSSGVTVWILFCSHNPQRVLCWKVNFNMFSVFLEFIFIWCYIVQFSPFISLQHSRYCETCFLDFSTHILKFRLFFSEDTYWCCKTKFRNFLRCCSCYLFQCSHIGPHQKCFVCITSTSLVLECSQAPEKWLTVFRHSSFLQVPSTTDSGMP